MRRIRIVFTADAVRPDEVRGAVTVVIDVLRASTTIVTALANGCPAVIPAETPEEARQIAHERGCLLGGERENLRIAGFDFGNSPLEYTPDKIMGRIIAFTTTNGTRAIRACTRSDMVVVASFINGGATVQLLDEEKRDIVVVCAGSCGEFSVEDTACGGMLLEALNAPPSADVERAVALWKTYGGDLETMMKTVSEHGRKLLADGFKADIAFAAGTDRYNVVAVRKGDSIVRWVK